MTTDMVVRGLAVVGAAVIGGLGLSLLAQLLARAFTTRRLPHWSALIVRLLGGLICGWLIALWLFGGNGSGIGGPGGGWFGSNRGEGEGEKTPVRAKPNGDGKKANEETTVPDAEKLHIEVLVKDVLKKLGSDESHCYRVSSADGARLLTFPEVKELIKRRQEKQPPLRRIEIVLYKDDSPAQDKPVVKSLATWAGDLIVKGGGNMDVRIILAGANAP